MTNDVGARLLVVWPGQDGFDYTFQADCVAQWERALESLRAIADGARDLQVAIEYKWTSGTR
jgi:xylose isomerase